jgi:CubicO group peptidase (beta-lactamase class C family)
MSRWKMRSILALAFLVAVPWGSPVASQELSPVAPDSVGVSSKRLERLREFTAREMEQGRISGAVTLVARGDRVVFFEATGMGDREHRDPMRKDSIFRIRSMTKPIVSLAVLMLYERGEFLLDDPVTRFLPELENLRVVAPTTTDDTPPEELETVPAERDITILDLLTHRAGLTYGFINQGPVGELYRRAKLEEWKESSEELVRRLAELPLVRQPGLVHEYSIATDVLGRMVEVVSGQRLDVFLRESIFEPLGMKDTYFYLPPEKANRLVTLYRSEEGKTLQPLETADVSPFVVGPRVFFSGAGGLVSTASDYYRFLRLLLNEGELDGVRLVGTKTVELMTQDHVHQEIGIHPGYGFGLGVAVRQATGGVVLGSEGEYTWGGIDNTVFWVDPKEHLISIFMTNVTPYDLDQRWYFKTAVYQAIVE